MSGRVTAAKIMWRRLRCCQRKALKAAAGWTADMDIDEEAEWVLPGGALDERDDWRAQWVRVCMEHRLAETKRMTETVEDLWFSLRRDQRAALQTMALVMDRARRAAQTPDLDGDWSWDRWENWQSDGSDTDSDDGAGGEGGSAVGAAPEFSARGNGGQWPPGSMERYKSVQHELRDADCRLSAARVQFYRPWHGHIGSASLQMQYASVLHELRTVSVRDSSDHSGVGADPGPDAGANDEGGGAMGAEGHEQLIREQLQRESSTAACVDGLMSRGEWQRRYATVRQWLQDGSLGSGVCPGSDPSYAVMPLALCTSLEVDVALGEVPTATYPYWGQGWHVLDAERAELSVYQDQLQWLQQEVSARG